MKLPSVYFDLYLISDVVTRKFKVMLQSMSFQAVTLILSYIVIHKFKINLKKTLTAVGSTIVLVAVLIIGARTTLSLTVGHIYFEDAILMSMEVGDTVPNKVFKDPVDLDYFRKTSGDKSADILSRIKKRGVLRVGYNAEALPFAFFNQRNELVGYDIFFAHQLARDLGVAVDFIPVDQHRMRTYLAEGICDIIMSAVPITTKNLGLMNFTNPYMDMNAALIVKDYVKKDFRSKDRIAAMRGLRIAYTPANTQQERRELKTAFRSATPIELPSIKDFFIKENLAEALLTTDKIGKAWALLYPEFGVAVPHPVLFRYDIAYAVPFTQGDHLFLEYLNHWLKLKSTSGVATQQFDYWILGKTPQRKTHRWSIIRNVLHWVQ
jgi:ABC-type amino acid transport substrate-binding protein